VAARAALVRSALRRPRLAHDVHATADRYREARQHDRSRTPRPERFIRRHALHRAYFNDEALWTYLTTPFLLAMEGVTVEETEPWNEGAETWRVLRAHFLGSIETHSLVQDFFFDGDLTLRRHDYNINIAGGFGGAQLTSNYTVVNGIHLPTRAPRLHARPRTPTHLRHVDGFN